MARNVRNITVKGFTIKYAVAKNGELAQGEFVTGISNPRKQVKAIADMESVAPESVIIITTTSADTTYVIDDINEAIDTLVGLELAHIKNDANKSEEK